MTGGDGTSFAAGSPDGRPPEPGADPAPKPPLRSPPGPGDVLLRVLATTDLHANVLSYDYAANRPSNGFGLSQMAGLIAAARAEVPGSLLLDNGDFLQGTALADLAAQGRRRRHHPVIAAMNVLQYDAATLGNHEFNYGLGVLRRALAEARFPVVSANVLTWRAPGDPLLDETLVPPHVILERQLSDLSGRRHVLRIGILGLTPPEILLWDQPHLAGRLETRPMLEAAAARVPELRRAGADLVICLAHTGIAEHPGGDGRDGLAADLAEVPGIDALVLGHSHLLFPGGAGHSDPRVDPSLGRIADKPAVQPGFSGSHLGIMDLRLRRKADGWAVAGAEVRAESVSEIAAGLPASALRFHAEPLRQAVGDDHRAALAWTRRTLGRSELNMSTAFAQVMDGPALRLLGMAKIDHARRALAGTADAGLPVLATATPYRSGGRGGPLNYTSIAAGPLSVRHLGDLYPFPNTVVAFRISGGDLAELLERSASLYARIVPGRQEQRLIDPAFPVHAFATVIGVSYEIDPSEPARYDQRGDLIRPHSRRIRNLSREGMPVRRDDRFVLVSNSFRASGSLGMPAPHPDEVLLDRRERCTDVLRDYIRRQGHITRHGLRQAEGWRLRPLPGTGVLHETGPDALAHLDEAHPLRPEPAGLTAEGFHLLRLQL